MQISPKILFVDDEQIFVGPVKQELEKKQCNVAVAQHISQAMAHLRDNWVDVVLLDVLLPDGTGLEILQRTRIESLNPSPFFIVITANPHMPEVKHILMYGVTSYLEKGGFGTLQGILDKLSELYGPLPSSPPGNLISLARMIKSRRENNAEPFVLFLGAGASITSGCSPLVKIIDDFLFSWRGWPIDKICSTALDKKMHYFENCLEKIPPTDRHGFFSKHVQHKTISSGHRTLARLISQGYFRTILTSNLDNLLEMAQAEIGRTSVVPFVFDQGDNQDKIDGLKRCEGQPLLKLHGDLQQRIYLITSDEIFGFAQSLEVLIGDILSKDIIIIGHSFRDLDLIRCLRMKGGSSIWCINPSPPMSPLTAVMKQRKSEGLFIEGLFGQFDILMEYLGQVV